MCGRFTLTASAQQVRDLFEVLEDLPHFSPRYNIAPTQDVLVIRAGESGREARMMRWGLIPFWAKDTSIGSRCINARGETVAEKPAFRAAYKSRRCLVPTDGFYEWKAVQGEKKKQPYYITLKGHDVGAFAGLYERWTDPEGDVIESCSIITTEPNDLVASLHNRMPVFLDPDVWAFWMDAESRKDEVGELIRALPSERFVAYPVSRDVNSVANDDAHLIERVELDQRELF